MRLSIVLFLLGCALVATGAEGEHVGFGDPSTWKVVGCSDELASLKPRSYTCIRSNAVVLVDSLRDDELLQLLIVKPRWKSEAERKADEERVARILPRIQEKLDVFVPKWIADGNCLEGKPWESAKRRSSRERDQREVLRRIKYGNCMKVMLPLVARDKILLSECVGLPFDMLVEGLRFPEPRYEEADGKGVFALWASLKVGKRLTPKEAKILFGWQFYVVQHEKRPWLDVALSFCGAQGSGKIGDTPPQFEDFVVGKEGVAAFVESWYEKAVAAGMTPADEDKRLLEKARFSKVPWTGHANIVFADGFVRRTIKIHGAVPLQELQSALHALMGGLGMDERTDFVLELDEPDNVTLKNVLDVFSCGAVDTVKIRSDAKTELDISGLAAYKELRVLELGACMLSRSVPLSNCRRFSRFRAKACDLGKLEFLSGGVALEAVEIVGCSFTELDRLWASEQLCDLAIPNAKGVVDLSVVRKLEHLGSLDITECRVKNFMALKGHPSLRRLKMRHVVEGVDSLTFLAENPMLQEVEYDKADYAPSVYMEFARACRMKEYAYSPRQLLQSAVEDRDLPEIRRLCDTDVDAGDALSRFEFTSESDMEIFRLLVPRASRRVLDEQLENCIRSFGYGRSRDKSPFVSTNRAELVSLLLAHGAQPGDMLTEMVHPLKKDMELFGRIVSKTTDKKVLTELLNKNIKAFGNDPMRDRNASRDADRLDVIRVLLANGADPNTRTFFGNTALGNAVEYDGDVRLVKLLLDNGADASLLYPGMELFRGFYSGNENILAKNRYELVKLLVAHGFDVNAKGKFGKTPLGELTFFGGRRSGYDLKMAEFLLEHGADPNVRQGDELGSATDLAYGRRGAEKLLDLLVKHGGVVSEEAKQKRSEERRGNSNGEAAAEKRRQNRSKRSARRQDASDGRMNRVREEMDRVREEMDRFHEEMRKCSNSDERRRLMDERMKRMRQIRESSEK